MLNLEFFFSEDGKDYAFNSSKTTNTALTLLRRMYDDNIVSLPKFDDITLNLTNFDWAENGQDRNWWWQLQSFPFLAHYRSSFSLLSEFDKKYYLIKCLDTIVNWVKKTDDKSPLKWHDHATAFRLRSVLLWLAFCVKNDLTIHLVSECELLHAFILGHCEWLLLEKNYSKHTNHGFDQAMILLIASLMSKDTLVVGYRDVAEKRLLDEINFAFTSEGVHKENSAGYQKFMYQRLKQLQDLEVFGINNLSDYVGDIIKKARDFFAVITLPNGMLPMTGDTLSGVTGLRHTNDGVEIYDYSKSGYIIAKGLIKNKDFYLLFKNSHESNYHRHDDDLSIFLYYDGKVILADGGLGSHNESSPERKIIRSALNHNSILLDECQAIRNNTHLIKKPVIKRINQECFYGESHMFGVKIRREIDLTEVGKGVIRVENQVFSNDNAKINFISEEAVEIENNMFFIGDSCSLKLNIPTNTSYSPYYNKESTYISKKYSSYEFLNNFGWNFNNNVMFEIFLGN